MAFFPLAVQTRSKEGAKGRKVCEVRFPEMGDEPMCGSQDEEAFCGMQSAPQSNDEALLASSWCARVYVCVCAREWVHA